MNIEEKFLEVGDNLYGVDNEIYTVENVNKEQIIVKFYKKIYLTYNSGYNQEIQIKEEYLYFSFDDIGIKIFFKEGDCYKSANELLEDNDYSNYIKNLNNRINKEVINEKKRQEYIASFRPNTIKITNEDVNKILLSYYNEEKSFEEEKENLFLNHLNL